MFLGHFAVALAAKRAAPRASLGTLVAAGQAIDLLWPVLVLAGLESFRIEPGNTAMTPLAFDSYPWSHSLLMTLLLAILFGAVVARWGSGLRSGVVAGFAVASHWLLDYVTHRPDLQLAPWLPERVGLGLWDYPAAAIPLEGALFLAAALSYAWGTRARDRVGSLGYVLYIALLAGLFALNLTSPPPPSTHAVALTALALWLFVAWAAWIDRHRESRVAPRREGADAPAT